VTGRISFWLLQVLNGVSFGMLLFLLAAGLSVTMGLMRIVNLAHGSFYLLGAYLGVATIRATGSFLLALLVAAVAGALVGLVVHGLVTRASARGESRLTQELSQVLVTFGVIFVIGDVTQWAFGLSPYFVEPPAFLAGSVRLGEIVFPEYRLFVIVVGILIAVGLWLVLEKTRLGAIVRAGVEDAEMVRGLGIPTSVVAAAVFAFGAMLASAAGVLGGPLLGAYPGAEFLVLLLALVVVVVGGIGSLRGAFVGSLLVGLISSFGTVLVSQLALFLVFLPMAIILIVRPIGLFGRR
jgi:branched-chain amino acid transport system permease protein